MKYTPGAGLYPAVITSELCETREHVLHCRSTFPAGIGHQHDYGAFVQPLIASEL